ncbi:MAG: zinc ribbon domain-containing protein, partial [Bacteroidaceae bacterium]|nr:zinc ribbon domain-containing protein [Bacteroidaceae bacterium]
MYCPECGTKIEDDARFCPECGTRMEQATHNVDDVQECAAEDSKDNDIVISCIILTNINLLAKSLHADANDIRTLLQQFIDIKKQAGIRYLLADASNYTYCKRGFLGARKKVSLDANSSIWDYTDILMDIHTHEESGKRIVSEYVFIVGGNDVIPMPCTKNYVAHNKDNKTVDSDILYSFPYGKEMLANLENLEIFKYD